VVVTLVIITNDELPQGPQLPFTSFSKACSSCKTPFSLGTPVFLSSSNIETAFQFIVAKVCLLCDA
jgi:hypothetical protein